MEAVHTCSFNRKLSLCSSANMGQCDSTTKTAGSGTSGNRGPFRVSPLSRRVFVGPDRVSDCGCRWNAMTPVVPWWACRREQQSRKAKAR